MYQNGRIKEHYSGRLVEHLSEVPYENILNYKLNLESQNIVTISNSSQFTSQDVRIRNVNVLKKKISSSYDNNLGVVLVLINDILSVLSQVLLGNSKCIILPRHVFELLYVTDNRHLIILCFKSYTCTLSYNWMINHIIYKHLDLDLVLIKLPFILSHIQNIRFQNVIPSCQKTIHFQESKEDGKKTLQPICVPLDGMIKHESFCIAHGSKYTYTHLHTPTTYPGSSGALILSSSGIPWGITVASNGSINGIFLNEILSGSI